MQTKPFSFFLSVFPRELTHISRKLPQRVKFAWSLNSSKRRPPKYPLSFHLDTRYLSEWPLGVWRAYSYGRVGNSKGGKMAEEIDRSANGNRSVPGWVIAAV